MGDGDDQRLAFQHSEAHVAAVLDALYARLDTCERQFLRSRDLDIDVTNGVVGSVLALVADRPDAIEDVYELDVEITAVRPVFGRTRPDLRQPQSAADVTDVLPIQPSARSEQCRIGKKM